MASGSRHDAQVNIGKFNGGEISDRAQGHIELPQYQAGGREYRNVIPNLVGGLERRPGTRYVSAATNATGNSKANFSSSGSWLISFDVAEGASYVLELSDYKMRFYREGGVLLHSFANFLPSQVNTTANQFEIDGHGFFNHQRVRFRLNPGATIPASDTADRIQEQGFGSSELVDGDQFELVDGGIYHIVLPEAIPIQASAESSGDRYTLDGYAGYGRIAAEMGPYTLTHDTLNDWPGDAPVWVHSVTAPSAFAGIEQCKFSQSKNGAVIDNGGTFGTGAITMMPTLAAKTGTFRICPVAVVSQDCDAGGGTGNCYPRDEMRNYSRNGEFTIRLTNVGEGGGYFEPVDLEQPYELTTPWSYEEAKHLQYSKDGDRMVFTGGQDGHPPYELLRVGVSAFVLQRLAIEGGPLGAQSPYGSKTTLKITGVASGAAVTKGELITLEASSKVFRGSDVGRPIRKTYADEDDALRHIDAVIERVGTKSNGTTGYSRFEFGAFRFRNIDSDGFFHRYGGDQIGAFFFLNRVVWIVPDIGSELPYPSQFDPRTPYYIVGDTTMQVSTTLHGEPISGFSGGGGLVISDGISENTDTTGDPQTDWAPEVGLKWCGLHFDGEAPGGLHEGIAYQISTDEVLIAGAPGATFTYTTLLTHTGERVPLSSIGAGKFWVSGVEELSATVVARVIRDGPEGESGSSLYDPTNQWRMGVLNAYDGYPSAVTIHQERLLMAGTRRYPMTVWSSEQAIATSFLPDTRTGTDIVPGRDDRTISESGGWAYVLDEEKSQRISWMFPTTVVICGTAGPIHQLSGFTPTTVVGELVTSRGTSDVRPVISDAQIVWCAKKHSRIFAAGFDDNRAGYKPDDLTLLADHAFTGQNKLIQLALQEEPWSVIWAVREDGLLWSCTYDLEQGVKAWAHHKIGGSHSLDRYDYKLRQNVVDQKDWAAVKSICTIPSADERFEEVWMVVERHAGGQAASDGVFRSIEYMTRRFELDDRQEDAYYVDCGVAPYDLNAPSSSFTAHDVLANRDDLAAWIDGDSLVASSDSASLVTLPTAAQYKIIAGIPYTWKWHSLSIEAMLGEIPTFKGIQGVIPNLLIHVVRSVGGRIGSPDYGMQPLNYPDQIILGEPASLFSGDLDVDSFPDSPGRTQEIILDGTGAGPFFVTNIVGRLTGGADGR